MSTALIALNVVVMAVAAAGAVYLCRVYRRMAGTLRKGMTYICAGFGFIVIEHIFIAYLRRSQTPLEAGIWFIPLPLFIIAIVLFLVGGYKLKKLTEVK